LLKKSKALADKHGTIFHIHVAETRQESKMIGEEVESQVVYLDGLGCLEGNVVACHSIWVSENDQEILKKRGVGISHCPVSNMKLASGVAPVPDMLDRGITVSLGTDGASSNNSLNMLRTMDIAAKLHKLYQKNPTVLPAKKILKMATIEGAKVLGLEDEVGSLEVGKKADIIIINTKQPHLTPFYDFTSLIYTAKRSDVATVIVDGKVLMHDRKLTTIDEEEAIQNAKKYGRKVHEEIRT
jgi:5-methylthioadenosine/S-adenosylhomocysteine deaminase